MKPYYEHAGIQIYHGNALEVPKSIEPETVQCCVTSPPYWGLRDYGIDGQLGLEKTPEEYVEKMVMIFREVRRVLKNDGTLWLNLGDSYAGFKDCKKIPQTLAIGTRSENACVLSKGNSPTRDSRNLRQAGLKNKDLCGIPWRVAFALQKDGWYLRSDIIWAKPNPMPESVTDRPTKSHEYIFLMSKNAKYFYDADAISEPSTGRERWFGDCGYSEKSGRDDGSSKEAKEGRAIRNKRSVWTVTTKPYKEAHFATFPPDLITPCIKAGSRKGDIIIDPFGGSMTTAYVAKELNRKAIMIELNEEYIDMGINRLRQEVLPFG